MSVKKQKCFSQADKLEIIAAHEAGKSRIELMREYGLPLSSFYRIIRQRDSIIQQCLQGNGNLRRNRGAGFPHVERCVLEWIYQQFDQSLPMEGPTIKAQAKLFSIKLGIEDFCASNGWLHGFKKRHGISFNRSQHEEFHRTLPTGPDGLGADWASRFTALLDECDSSEIYSLVETGLFYSCLPEQIDHYQGKDCRHGEHGKDRVTVLLCGNVTGTDKLPILAIGQCSRATIAKDLPPPTIATYECNWNAWITRELFQAWLKKVDQTMRETDRQIVLLVNHSPAHAFLCNLTNVRVIFYSARSGEVQYPHRKLIRAFKRNFRTELVSHLLECRKNAIVPNVSIAHAVQVAAQAWDTITSDTIVNSFMQPHCWMDGLCDSSEQNDNKADAIWPHEADRQLLLLAQNKPLPNFGDYVRVDENVAAAGILTDDKIVEMVMNLDQTEGASGDYSATDSEKLKLPVGKAIVSKGVKRKTTSPVVQTNRQRTQQQRMVAKFTAAKATLNEMDVERHQTAVRKEDALDAIKKLHQFFVWHDDTNETTFEMLYELERCVQSVKEHSIHSFK
ncbi:tigger transposable element-derived protein 4-like [Anopheles merus]|uniref:tigger transposable element-derived protein 4-like n=1 Tax=Anopheles merus TaxID=30066 RepID=UPI001BE42E9C|nr:tigger transposable element-derived protein 4-like [Anopheles merus]